MDINHWLSDEPEDGNVNVDISDLLDSDGNDNNSEQNQNIEDTQHQPILVSSLSASRLIAFSSVIRLLSTECRGRLVPCGPSAN